MELFENILSRKDVPDDVKKQIEAAIINHKRVEETLRDAETRYRILFEHSPDGVVIIDPATARVVEFNGMACRQLGYSREEFSRLNISDLDVSETPDETQARIGKVISEGRSDFETLHRTKQGEIRNVHVTAQYIDTHRVYHCIWRDITERKKAEEALRESERRYRELSIIDDLTQLNNSRYFHHQLNMEIDRAVRYGQPLTLLLMDLDNFKAYNDAYGHVEGDQVLSRLGQVVKRCLRHTDSAYRYGGEEFVILLPMATVDEGFITAERIRTEFKSECFFPVPDQEVHVTLSIGVAQCKPQEESKALVHRVDQLMYQAKKNGRDRICSENNCV